MTATKVFGKLIVVSEWNAYIHIKAYTENKLTMLQFTTNAIIEKYEY